MHPGIAGPGYILQTVVCTIICIIIIIKEINREVVSLQGGTGFTVAGIGVALIERWSYYRVVGLDKVQEL